MKRFKPIVLQDAKQCVKCLEIKHVDNFCNSKRGRLGKMAYCKPCWSKYQLDYLSKEERKEKTATYRKNNVERVRSLNRIVQFNRRNKIKVQSDGTVNDKYLKDIYNSSECYYCGSEIPFEKRTIDHVIPLSRGGLHSKDNLVMACESCNCSKKNKNEEEFKEYRNQ